MSQLRTTGRRGQNATGGRDASGRGWYTTRVVGTASLGLALTAPGQTAAISVFIDPLVADLGISRSAIAGAYAIGSVAGAWTLPLLGRAIDRWGPRVLMATVGAAFGAVLIALSAVTGLVGLTAGFIGIRLAGQGALSLIATTAVAVFIDRRRGLAQGVAGAIGTAGISLTPILLEALIGVHGFRQVWVFEGLAIWATVIPLALLGLPRRRRSTSPPRSLAGSGTTDAGRAGEPPVSADWTLPEALRTGMFWLVTGGVGVSGMLGTGLAFHQIDILGERGLSPVAAAANFVPQTVAGLVATLLTGYLADRVADRYLIAGSMSLLILALLGAAVLSPGWSAIGYGVALGAAGSSIRTLEATAFPDCFGLTHLGAIRGVVHMVGVASTAFGPLLFAVGQAWTGTYTAVLIVSTTLPIGVVVAAFLIRRPVRASVGTGRRST